MATASLTAICADKNISNPGPQTETTVEWRVVPGWPEYEVSEHGLVRRRLPGGSPIGKVGRVLRTSPRKYKHVYLHGQAGRRHLTVHRLVALAFIGDPPSPSHQVAHYDGNRANNHYSNLRYATAAENTADKRRHGTIPLGESSRASRLTEEVVRQIRALGHRGVPQELIAEIFGTSQSHIARILRFESWSHVQ
jgi:hypothetical protein